MGIDGLKWPLGELQVCPHFVSAWFYSRHLEPLKQEVPCYTGSGRGSHYRSMLELTIINVHNIQYNKSKTKI